MRTGPSVARSRSKTTVPARSGEERLWTSGCERDGAMSPGLPVPARSTNLLDGVACGHLVLSFGRGIQVRDPTVVIDRDHGVADVTEYQGLELELPTLHVDCTAVFFC
jgi:hypothetical protein